jgi:hypothetical protein
MSSQSCEGIPLLKVGTAQGEFIYFLADVTRVVFEWLAEPHNHVRV